MTQFYQGDIPAILANDKISEFASKIKFNKLPADGLIVALGEVTGHKHVITATPQSEVYFGEDEHGRYIKVATGEATLVHNKHAAQTLTRGLWFIGSQWEYNELAERKVQD